MVTYGDCDHQLFSLTALLPIIIYVCSRTSSTVNVEKVCGRSDDDTTVFCGWGRESLYSGCLACEGHILWLATKRSGRRGREAERREGFGGEAPAAAADMTRPSWEGQQWAPSLLITCANAM